MLNQKIKTGDEVVIKDNEEYDILTVLKVNNDNTITCFEYNPKQAFILDIEDVEIV